MKQYLPRINKKGILLVMRSSGITLASVALLVFMGIKINSLTAIIVKAHDQRTASAAKLEQFDKLKNDAASVSGAIAQLNAAIPTMDNMPLVVDYVNTLGAKTGTTVAVQFNPATHSDSADGLAQIGFALQASGPYQAMLALLKMIETAPYLISMKAVDISVDQASPEQVSMQSSGIVYIQTAPQ